MRSHRRQVTSEIHNEVYQLMDKMAPPVVPTYCLYGYNISTLISVSYPDDFAGHGADYVPRPGTYDMSDMGDGTVPLQSLQECKSWIKLGAEVNCKVLPVGISLFPYLTEANRSTI